MDENCKNGELLNGKKAEKDVQILKQMQLEKMEIINKLNYYMVKSTNRCCKYGKRCIW